MMKFKKVLPSSLLVIFGLMACRESPDLETVLEVDYHRYMGAWYEIARLPNRFEKGLSRVSATYTYREDGNIKVLNKGYTKDGKLKKSVGKAYVPDTLQPGRLKVQFFWPFAGDYFIIDLDTEYQYALVGSPNRKFLWILSRQKTLPQATTTALLQLAKSKGFDVAKMEEIQQ